MSNEDEVKISEYATIEQALHIIVERELSGDDALDKFWGQASDLIHAQTIGVQEYENDV